jgi:hypothetical protein
MNCCICGPVKNCGPYLLKVFENIELIGSLFDDYKIIIFYDNSTDNTLDILKDYQNKNDKLIFYINTTTISKFRTHRLAYARNFCLNFVKKNKELFPYFIMMDFDNVNSKNINIEILKKSLIRNDWDGLSFNTHPIYYDTWALSIKPFYFSYLHFKFNNYYRNDDLIKNYINELFKLIPKNLLIKCLSAFGGFSIYRTNKFLDTYYDGRIRLDLIEPNLLNEQKKFLKTKITFNQKSDLVNTNYEDCEHRAFHLQAIKNSGARILISPEILFTE